MNRTINLRFIATFTLVVLIAFLVVGYFTKQVEIEAGKMQISYWQIVLDYFYNENAIRISSILIGLAVFIVVINFTLIDDIMKRNYLRKVVRSEDDLLNTANNENNNTKKSNINNFIFGTLFNNMQDSRLYQTMKANFQKYGMTEEVINEKLYRANIRSINYEQYIFIKFLLFFMGLLYIFYSSIGSNNVFGIVVAIALFMFPDVYLNTKINKREQEIRVAIPLFIDLLASIVKSGMSLQEAVKKIANKLPGALSEELLTVDIETKLSGGNWVQSLRKMALRNNIEPLTEMVSIIATSAEKGLSSVTVLKELAEKQRYNYQKSVEEKAGSLGLKLLPVIVLFDLVPLIVFMAYPIKVSAGM